MQPHMDATSYRLMRRFIFGGDQVPRWAGYTIGCRIVQAFLQHHPSMTIEGWKSLDAHDLLRQSSCRPSS